MISIAEVQTRSEAGAPAVADLELDEMLTIGGGGIIAVGCAVAAGGAAVAVVGVIVGVTIYALVSL